MDNDLSFGETSSDPLYDGEPDETEIDRPDEMVELGYASTKNVSFRGEISTGYTRQEWAEMRPRHRTQAIDELLAALVDVWLVNDDGIEFEEE